MLPSAATAACLVLWKQPAHKIAYIPYLKTAPPRPARPPYIAEARGRNWPSERCQSSPRGSAGEASRPERPCFPRKTRCCRGGGGGGGLSGLICRQNFPSTRADQGQPEAARRAGQGGIQQQKRFSRQPAGAPCRHSELPQIAAQHAQHQLGIHPILLCSRSTGRTAQVV